MDMGHCLPHPGPNGPRQLGWNQVLAARYSANGVDRGLQGMDR